MAFEDELGWEYFGNDPHNSPRMMEHMTWHTAEENVFRTGKYGERFLSFHRKFVEKFDDFRRSKGLLPVTAWDPATVIPPALAHEHTLMAARDTDNPSAVNPLCITPSWATIAGGSDLDPLFGYTNLLQFQSLDELGKAIDSGWHGVVHNTIGGDMMQYHSPIDPVFWRWHKWVDSVRAHWELGRRRFVRPQNVLSLVRVLFGVINDAPGVVIGPDGRPHPVPGGPGDPTLHFLTPQTRDVLLGQLVQELGSLSSQQAVGASLQQLGAAMLKADAARIEH
jgi:hypothetical protein